MAASNKGKIPNEAKLGFAFLLAIFIFVYGMFYLKDYRITGGTYKLEAEFQNISGLKRSDPVLLGGVRIGKTESIGLDGQTPIAFLRIEDEYQIPRDSYVEIIDRSVMGEKGIEVHKGTSPQMAEPGDRLTGQVAAGLFSMVSMADSLSTDLQTLIGSMNAILSPETDSSIKNSLVNVEEITGTLKTTLNQERRQIHRVITNLDSLVNTIQGISTSERGKISATMSNLEKTSGQLSDMIAQLQGTTSSLETILQRMERGEGTLGMLLKDDKLYSNMDRLMVNLDGLVVDLKENPKRYLNISIF